MSDLFGHNTGTAVISDCGRYRYRLTRGQVPFVAWLMLNPSTADAQVDDPTIRRCTRFADRWGYGGIIVVNIYPFRSSSPAECRRWHKNQGHDEITAQVENRGHIRYAESIASLHVVAFGAGCWDTQDAKFASLLFKGPKPLRCLGTNKHGWPLHPMARGKLRVPDDQRPVPWEWPEVTA